MLRPSARHAGISRTPRRARFARRPAPALKLLAIVLVLGLAATSGLATSAHAQSQVTASLAGTVTDGEGNAVAQAQVVLKRQVAGSSWLYHETATDGNGAYSLSGIEQGTWNLSFRRDGYRSDALSMTFDIGEAKTHNASLSPLAAAYYRGVVKHAESGAAIEGAVVRTSSWMEHGEQVRETETAADGSFQLRLFPTENSISIMKGGFATYHDWTYAPSEDIERGDIHLSPVPPQSATIQGRIIDANGNGVQAYVSMWPDWNAGASGQTTHAYEDSTEPGYASPDVWYPYGENHNNTVSAADGSFSMRAYPGAVVIEANRAGYLVARTTATLTEDGTTETTLELSRLPERTVTLTGTVRNAANGTPVPGANVNVQVPAAGDYAWATTDAQGRFEVTVRPGYTLIEVSHWGGDLIHYAEAVEDKPMTDAEPGPATTEMTAPRSPSPRGDGTRYHPASLVFTTERNTTRDLDVQLVPKPEPTTSLVGYVVDATTNEAIPDAHVALQNHDTNDWGDARTDADGSFRFKTNGGYHTLRVHIEGYLPYATNVKVQDSGTQRVDLLVTAGHWANEGWWTPDGGADGGYHPMPMPAAMDEDGSTAMSEGAADRASGAGFDLDGSRSLAGGAGGLGPYTQMGSETEAPAPGLFVLLVALAALAAAVRRRRS